MSKLNKDVIFLILRELKDDNKSIYSCLFVNRTWCKMTVPILWNDPTRRFRSYPTDDVCNMLLNVILLHLSEESKVNLKNQGINLFIETYQRPLFNYISFWKHLNLHFLDTFVEDFKISILGKEILNLFNMNTKFVSFSVREPCYIDITGTESCFSELEYFYCDGYIGRDILEKLAEINTSIKKFRFIIGCHTDNPGIIRLIEVQKNLKEVNLIHRDLTDRKSYRKTLEESLIKCVDTIQYLKINWKPITKSFSYLINLVSLEIRAAICDFKNWNHLEKVSLPLLKFLKFIYVPFNFIASLIKSTKGYLIEIIITYQGVDDGTLIQAIYQNCPNLNYLKLTLFDSNISEFENVLINCQFLMGLEVIGLHDNNNQNPFNWAFG
jgi:hypothetical protein